MFVHYKEFITFLRASGEYDECFLTNINAQLESSSTTGGLSDDQIEIIQKAFSIHWLSIADTKSDYTFSPFDTPNTDWIKFAKAFAAMTNKTYLQFLIPTVTNTIDPLMLEKHTDCNELRAFYLGDDGKTLYRIRGLFNHFKKSELFSTYDNDRKLTLRSLSLRELQRIRSKAGTMYFQECGKSYISFWDYLIREIAPTWQAKGEIPRHLLNSLLQVVECYFDKEYGHERFLAKLLSWGTLLQECPIEDVNCLYGQPIQFTGGCVFLIEVFLNCFEPSRPSLDAMMLGIVSWVCHYDISFVHDVTNQEMIDTIKTMTSLFQVQQILELLNELLLVSSRKEQLDVALLIKNITFKPEITADILDSLASLYRRRWLDIQATQEDYTRLQKPEASPWVKLAQVLSGAGYIDRNYYCFLMPTLKHSVDLITQESISSYPLSHFILSKDATELIYLGHCEEQFKAHRTFYKCNTNPPERLHPIEIARLKFANERFRKYIKVAKSEWGDDLPLSKSTVLEVKLLVEQSLYPNGLLYMHNYSAGQMETAQRAYYHFLYEFMPSISEDERLRLNQHRIIFQGKNRSFAEVMADVKNNECIAVCGQFFAQLVMDYISSWPELEFKLPIDEMSENSRKRVFREYDAIDSAEAKRRVCIIAVFIMDHFFSSWSLPDRVTLWDFSNKVEEVAKNMFEMIKPLIVSGNFKHARHTYTTLVEFIVKPALAKVVADSSHWLKRSHDTQKWMTSIVDGTLFSQETAWFESTKLITALVPVAYGESAYCRVISRFLDDIAQTYAQKETAALIEVRINIKFAQLLRSLDTEPRKRTLDLLQQVTSHAEKGANPFEIYADFLVKRLAYGAAIVSEQHQSGFFNKKTHPCDRQFYQHLKSILSKSVCSKLTSSEKLIGKLSITIESLAEFCDDKAKAKMIGFIREISNPILPVYAKSAAQTPQFNRFSMQPS